MDVELVRLLKIKAANDGTSVRVVMIDAAAKAVGYVAKNKGKS